MKKLNDYLKFLFEGKKISFLQRIKRKPKPTKSTGSAVSGARG